MVYSTGKWGVGGVVVVGLILGLGGNLRVVYDVGHPNFGPSNSRHISPKIGKE